MNIKRIGIVVKKGSSQGYEIAQKLLLYINNTLGLDVYIDEEALHDIKWDKILRVGVDPVDLIVVIGGDGTFLRTLHRIGFLDIPVMGIRVGRRGFLLDVKPDEALDRVKDVIEGRYKLVEYMRLETTLNSLKKSIPLALNEVVIAGWRYTRARVISLSIYVNDEHIYNIDGDGVIVATPLGSSAYALSAGGPIIDVDLESIVIVPLAPMQFNAKPIVIPPNKVVEIRTSSDGDPITCIVDGQSIEVVKPGGSIIIRRSMNRAKVLRFHKVDTYARLHEIWRL